MYHKLNIENTFFPYTACHSVLDTESHHYLSCEMLTRACELNEVKQVQHDTDDKTKTWCNLSDNH